MLRQLGVFLLILTGLSLVLKLDFLSASGRQPPEDDYDQQRQFNYHLDLGLSKFVNQEDYWTAINHFEAALKIKPRNPMARKSLRLAKEKVKHLPKRSSNSVTNDFKSPPVSNPIDEDLELLSIITPDLEESPEDLSPLSEPVSAFTPSVIEEKESIDTAEDFPGEMQAEIEKSYRKGLVNFVEEKYSKTIKQMEIILKLDPDHAKARKLLMKAHSLDK